MKLYVIAGHGGGDPGACSGGYTEAALVRKLAARMDALGGAQVTVLDTAKNWYQTGGISTLKIAKGDCLIELHMDSASASARGGHVVISSRFDADKYDKALAKYIGGKFPGRSATIRKRSDLANVNIAAARGINYRLLECCFISNKADRTELIKNMDEVAAGILAAFGIKAAKKTAATKASTATTKTATTKKSITAIAKEVIQGKWGNGAVRKKKLKAAGYDYAKVQAKVNELLR